MKMGQLLRLVRTSKGYSQKEMAELLGTSQNYLSLIESNKKKPSEDKIIEFAKKLNISKDAFILVSLEAPEELSSDEKEAFLKLQKNIVSLIIFDKFGSLNDNLEAV